MIDHNAWLGRWPFRDLGSRGEVSFLLEAMDRLEIHRAWVSPLDAVFHRAPHAANKSLMSLTSVHSDRLDAVPVFHPGLADGDEYLHRLVAHTDRPAAIRLVPALHAANDRFTERHVEALVATGITVVLTLRVMDARARHPMLPIPELTTQQVQWWLRKLCHAPVVLAGMTVTEVASLQTDILKSQAIVESSFLDGEESIDAARDILGKHRVVPGSNAPMNFQESLVVKWRPGRLTPLVQPS